MHRVLSGAVVDNMSTKEINLKQSFKGQNQQFRTDYKFRWQIKKTREWGHDGDGNKHQ